MTMGIDRLYQDEDGTTSVEYAFLMAVLVVATIAAWRALGSTVGNILQQSTTTVATGGS